MKNFLTHSVLQDSGEPSLTYETPVIASPNVSTDAIIHKPSPPSVDYSHTITIESGHTVVLQRSSHKWKGWVHDNRFPGFTHSYSANVKFGSGYSLGDLIKHEPSYQSRHVHLISNKNNFLVYIGSLGLKGGGSGNSSGNKTCTKGKCNNDAWRCKCGYNCPNKCCWRHCDHKKPHLCIGCKQKSWCPVIDKCTVCYSKSYCSNCCGCYERQSQERLRQQQEKERQEKIRVEKERERQAVLSKLDSSLASAPTAQKEATELLLKASASHAETADQIIQEDAYIMFIQDASNATDWPLQSTYANLTIDSESDSDTDSQSYHNSSNSIFSPGESHKSESPNGIRHSMFKIQGTGDKKDEYNNQESDLNEYSKLRCISWISNRVDRVLPSRTTTFLANYTSDLSDEERTHFYQAIGKFVKKKLSQVDATLRNTVIDYFTGDKILDSFVVQHYPVSEWIVQCILKILESYENDPFLHVFRTRWLKIMERYSISEQETLLKSLRTKQVVNKLSLSDISDIIGIILLTGTCGYSSIVCNSNDGWLSNLKSIWLEPKLDPLTQFSVEEKNKLCASLADMDWGVSMINQFVKSIQEEVRLDPVLELLSVTKFSNVSDSLVMSTITAPSTGPEKSKAQGWTQTIVFHSILSKLTLPPKETKAIALPLVKLLQSGCSAELMNYVFTHHLPLIEAHTANFIKVLELLYDYQVTERICALAFSHLSQVDSADWEDKIDELVSYELFQDSKIFTIDQLVDQISAESPAVTIEWLMACYNGVAKTYLLNSIFLQSLSDPSIDKVKCKPISDWNREDLAVWAKLVKLSTTVSQTELIAGVKRAVELHHQFSPRDTQLLSLLTLLNPSEGMGRLAQINTGEGKSIVVAMFAAVHALQNKRVDVITTSTELSIPEVKAQKPFFNSLCLTVDENSNNMTKRSAYECDVVYGIAGDFQADILRTEFLGQDIRGERGYHIVVVDEVDSMLFDNRSHSVRLSEQGPGMIHLELTLAAIWEHMKRTARHLTTIDGQTFFIAEDFKRNGKEITLYSNQSWESCAVLVEDKRSFIMEQTQHHLDQLLRELSGEEKNHYVAYKNLNMQINNLEEKMRKTTSSHEKQIIEADCKLQSENLKRLPWNELYPVLTIPIHLRSFSKSQVPFWIKSALNAAYGYKKGAHYTVQNGRIVPVHYNETGVLQSNMVWSDGLTQFLQLKEGLRMDPEGVATNFISNVSFFQRYGNSIYGLTGTLGEKPTKDYLHEIYHTDTIIIPPYQCRTIIDNAHSSYLCKELVPIVLSNDIEWFQAVTRNVLSHARRQRSALVICKYIHQVQDLAKELCEQYDSEKVFTYTGEDATFVKQKIDSGEIIVATNIAGRGKDLKTSPSVESHGGLYVCVTFLPETYRVEMQNVGRTSRSGKKGMAQLIMCDPFRTDICSMKQYRSEKEISDTDKATKDTQKLLLQDILFRDFCSLENEFLPTARSCDLFRKWINLKIAYKQHKAEELSADKISEHVNEKIKNRREELEKLTLGALTSEEALKITKDDEQKYFDQAAHLAESEQLNFELQYKKKVLKDFCNSQSHIPRELIFCLWEDRVFEQSRSALAEKFDWGLYDRKGFEEDWGFWLKGEHFEGQDISLDEARERFNAAFATPSKVRAQEDQLAQNPYFYVLKGNRYLVRGLLEPAIACYDRAIGKDPDFSVNALYNKAQALLSYPENIGDRQDCAQRALERAREIICAISRPTLLTFGALLAQDKVKIKTSEHVQFQLNLLGQQVNYIDDACKIIEEARQKGHHVKVTTQLISDSLDVADQDDHIPAIKEAAINGFTHLFTVQRVEPPLSWLSLLGLALLSIAQIAVGCIITACTGGAFGIGLITEGVSDMITVVKSAIQGSFDWAAWAVQKAISFAVSLISSGIAGLKDAYRAVVNTVKVLGTGGVTKCGVKVAARLAGTALAKGVVKECVTAAAEWCTNKLFMEDLEKTIEEQVQKTLTAALLNNPLVVKALELDVRNGNNFWQNCFIEEGLSLLKEEEEPVCITMLREISLGVASNKIPFTGQILQVAGIANMLDELANYTNKFIADLNTKIASYKTEVESSVQKIDSTKDSSSTPIQNLSSDGPHIALEEGEILADTAEEGTIYTSKDEPDGNSVRLHTFYSKRGPSSPQLLADAFKVQIAHKLTNSVRTNIVNPTIGYGVNKMSDKIFFEVDEANSNLLKEVRATKEKRLISNQLALANNKGREVDSSADEGNKSKLIASTQKGIERLKRDLPLDVNDLGALASIANAPIHVFDKKTGKLVDIVGDRLPGKPCFLVHEGEIGPNPGHWKPMDPNIVLHSNCSNNSLLDSVFAQLTPEKKKSLQNENGLKKKMIEMIQDHPEAANEAYEARDKLKRIASMGEDE